jgi:hypothetical protein
MWQSIYTIGCILGKRHFCQFSKTKLCLTCLTLKQCFKFALVSMHFLIPIQRFRPMRIQSFEDQKLKIYI